ncbi:MAG: hypothetical protein NC181_05320 [Clostridium sp.]|nr:hypothetical protein [Clostridium sp.]
MSNEKIDIQMVSDTTFKYLYKNERTKYWLQEIVKEKTGIDLTNYILVDNEDNTGSRIKDYRFDLLFNNGENNEFVIIELNREYSRSVEIKGRQYLYRKASHGFDTGENYDNPPNVKLIMLNNYYNKNNKAIMNINYKLYNKYYELEYDDIKIHEIYLKPYHEMCYDKCNKIDKRLWLLGSKNLKEIIDKKDNDNKIIVEELERLSMDSKFIDEYDYENVQRKLCNSARNEGRTEGLTEGIEQGSFNKAIEIAKNMLKENFDKNVISKITGLSINELNELK